MSFMELESFETDYYEIDGNNGITVIPWDSGHSENFLRDCYDGTDVHSIILRHGWLARYSAPGYMDCTPWEAGETREQAEDYAREYYGDDSDENESEG